MKTMIKILCLVGESGSGKSTIAELLSKEDKYNYVQSYTTRKARSSNEAGHIFVDELVYKKHKELDADINNQLKIIAETYFDGNYYWTVNTQFLKDKINVYVVDPKGVDDLRKINNFDIFTIYLNTTEHVRVERMLQRYTKVLGDETKVNVHKRYMEALNRIEHDREVFKVIKADYIVNSNRVPEGTLKDVKKVVEGWESNE